MKNRKIVASESRNRKSGKDMCPDSQVPKRVATNADSTAKIAPNTLRRRLAVIFRLGDFGHERHSIPVPNIYPPSYPSKQTH